MGSDRRRNRHAGNNIKQPGLSGSRDIPLDLGSSFSFRSINNASSTEYGGIEPDDSRPSTSLPREHIKRDHGVSKPSDSRSRSSERPSSSRSSNSRDRSDSKDRSCPKDYQVSEGTSFRRSKAMRRNSLTDRTVPLSYRGSEHSDHASYVSSDRSKPIGHRSSEHSKPRSYSKSRSRSRSGSYGRNGSIDISCDTTDTREYSINETRKKARRRNSCDYEYDNSKISAAGASKARRRNSCDYEYNSSKISAGGASKARRRNSCDYQYNISKISAGGASKAGRRSSFTNSFGEEIIVTHMNCEHSDRSEHRSIDCSDHLESKPLHSNRREYSGNEHNSPKHSIGNASKPRRRLSCDEENRSAGKIVRRNSFENKNKSLRSTTVKAEIARLDSIDNEPVSSRPSAAKASRRNSSQHGHTSSKTSAAKASRRNSCDYQPTSSRPSADINGVMRRSNSWNDSTAEEYLSQPKVAQQREPRRLKSYSNPGNVKSKSKLKRENKRDQNKTSTRKKMSKSKSQSSFKKKRASSSGNHLTSSNQKDTRKSQPSNIRLNSQLMKKIGDFRPYFVPLKKKQEVLTSCNQHEQTFGEGVESHGVNDGPAKILYESMKNISVASFLHEGIPVVKVSHSKLGKLRRRVLTLSEDQMTLFLTHSKLAKRNMIPKQPAWTPSKGWNGTYIRSVDVANICDFQVGVISSRRLELSIATHEKKKKMTGGDNSLTDTNNSKDFLPYMPDPARVASAVTIFHIDSRTGRTVSLDFFIENPDHRRGVVATLALMKYTYGEVSQLVGNEILLYRYILKDMNLGTNYRGMKEMNETEFLTLCGRLNYTTENVVKQFREFYKQHSDQHGNGGIGKNKNKLPIHECLQFVHLLKGKENPYVAAWRACFGTATCVDALTVLTKFLHGPQQEQKFCDTQDARDLVNVMNATELGEVLSNRKGSLLTMWQFEEFLRSEWNDLYDPEKRVIDKERPLNKPISHYWINSSFHTSSMSDGIPSIQSYTRSLSRGCKSIDLNCWDGIILPSGECVPIIMPSNVNPGTSFTVKNKLTFRSVVLIARKYIDENRTSYPIILNLEISCSQSFQKSMFKTMNEVFGKLLFVPRKIHRKKELPSPEDLRGMIVVNARMPPIINKDGRDYYRSKSMSHGDAYSTMFNKFNTVDSDSMRLESFPTAVSTRSFASPKHVDNQIGDELKSLSLFHDVRFSGYFLESMDLIRSQMHGIKDVHVPKIVKEYADNPELWRKFNESHMTRIYPSPGHSSKCNSNFNPVLAWGMGCQMTALNFQNDDTDLAINDGFFRQTGEIGYLEKPQWLLGIGKRPKPITIKIRLLSGSCIPKPFVGDKDGPNDDTIIDSPRVTLELHDVNAKSGHGERFKISKHKVKCGNKNGFFPIFDDKGKKFTVETPDVAMLVFRVEQNADQGKVISTTAVPVNCLRKGYRSVQLYDADNTRLGCFASASLLVFLM